MCCAFEFLICFSVQALVFLHTFWFLHSCCHWHACSRSKRTEVSHRQRRHSSLCCQGMPLNFKFSLWQTNCSFVCNYQHRWISQLNHHHSASPLFSSFVSRFSGTEQYGQNMQVRTLSDSQQLPASYDTPHTSHLTPHTSHLTPHTSHLTPPTSHTTPHTPHTTPHTPHTTPHTLHLTPRTSHHTPHLTHRTPHTSHLTPHTSHLRSYSDSYKGGDGCYDVYGDNITLQSKRDVGIMLEVIITYSNKYVKPPENKPQAIFCLLFLWFRAEWYDIIPSEPDGENIKFRIEVRCSHLKTYNRLFFPLSPSWFNSGCNPWSNLTCW